jgi:hypothetical protein
LAELYGSAASLELENGPTGGVRARMRVPFQLLAAEWGASS